MVEEWRVIEDFKNYQISNYGNIKSVDRQGIKRFKRGSILKPAINHKGYESVKLYKIIDGKISAHTRFIHRLVMIAFVDNPYNKPEVNHIDGIKTNNVVNNLEWATTSENIKHAFDLGIKKSLKGEKHPSAKLTNEIGDIIRSKYKRGVVEYKDLAKEYGVNINTIGLIVRKKIYV